MRSRKFNKASANTTKEGIARTSLIYSFNIYKILYIYIYIYICYVKNILLTKSKLFIFGIKPNLSSQQWFEGKSK